MYRRNPPRGARASSAVLAAVLSACGGGSSSSLPPPPPPAYTPPGPQTSSLLAAPPVPVAGLTAVHLGTFSVNQSATFQVPANTASVTIVQQQAVPKGAQTIQIEGTTVPNTVFPHSISVNGQQIFDVYADAINPGTPTGLQVYYFTDAAWAGAMTIPNTAPMLQSVLSSGGVPSGTWKLVVSDFANECPGIQACTTVYAYPASAYDITVLLKTAASPAAPISASGKVDLAFYLLTEEWDGQPDPAAAAKAALAPMLSSFGSIYASAGISLGNVNVYNLPASVKAKFNGAVNADDSSPSGDLAQLLTNALPGNQMNLFLVDRIPSSSNPSGTTTVGLDGTIPGPATFGGTVQSGAIVSVVDLAAAPSRVAYIAAHETGHFLGLYHTTEADGTWFDPLTGTPQCPCSSCRPAGAAQACQNSSNSVSAPYAMTGFDCTRSASCGGGDHLMFWVISSQSAGTISADEGQVMRANPLVY